MPLTRNEQVDTYIESQDAGARDLARALRELIFRAAPGVRETFKWSRPCYELDSRICSFQICARHISLCFDRGVHLDDPDALLEGTGKGMRHVKIRYADGIPRGVARLVRLAAGR